MIAVILGFTLSKNKSWAGRENLRDTIRLVGFDEEHGARRGEERGGYDFVRRGGHEAYGFGS